MHGQMEVEQIERAERLKKLAERRVPVLGARMAQYSTEQNAQSAPLQEVWNALDAWDGEPDCAADPARRTPYTKLVSALTRYQFGPNTEWG